MTPFVTRFAPSPTGRLHLGHAFSALTAFDAARAAGAEPGSTPLFESAARSAAGGRFLLRIEDIDASRRRPEFEAAIYEDLAWLGLSWEEPVRRQSEHMAEYEGALSRLITDELVYRCFKTRKELAEESAQAPHGAANVVRGSPLPADEEEARLAAGDAFAWRLRLERAKEHLGARWEDLGFEADGVWIKAEPERLGDAILARKEFPTSYHLASVWDDALQGVTCVIRGEDLAEAAHLHVLLQALLDLPTPAYRHHRLILGEDGKRLAKRDKAATLGALREAGKTAGDVRRLVGLD